MSHRPRKATTLKPGDTVDVFLATGGLQGCQRVVRGIVESVDHPGGSGARVRLDGEESARWYHLRVIRRVDLVTRIGELEAGEPTPEDES